MSGTQNVFILIFTFQSMLVNLVDYQKLEKIEVSGLMGRLYSPVIERLYNGISKFIERLGSIAYDPLDLFNENSNPLFLEDYNYYLIMSNDIEHRLAALSKYYFESSDNLMSLRKVNFHSF